MGLKTKFTALLALVSLAKFLPVLKWVPGLGPVAGIASSALSFVVFVVRKAFEGATIILTNPVTLIVVGFVSMTMFAVGLSMGSKEGRVRVAAMQQERDAAYVEAQKRLHSALEARKTAEEATTGGPADVSPMAPKAKPAPARRSPERVRAKPADSNRNGFCLSGFQGVFPGC